MTYNVQFLPGLARMANQRRRARYRARVIGRRLRKFGIIGLNEAFESSTRRILFGRIRQAWQDDFHAVTSHRPRSGRVSAGLAIISRFPIVATNRMTFSRGSSILKYGIYADSFAAKGAIHARVCGPSTGPDRALLDVFVTHLDSRDRGVRDRQFREFAAFVRRHGSLDRPSLMMGDFNTDGRSHVQSDPSSEYHHMLSLLGRARRGAPLVDLGRDCDQGDVGTLIEPSDRGCGRRVDYIFVMSPGEAISQLRPLGAATNPHTDRRVQTLSDHAALEGELLWRI